VPPGQKCNCQNITAADADDGNTTRKTRSGKVSTEFYTSDFQTKNRLYLLTTKYYTNENISNMIKGMLGLKIDVCQNYLNHVARFCC
jgi:hypothetical protein